MKDIKVILDTFVERINDYIVVNDWSIKQFAAFVGIPRTTVNSWILKKRAPRIDYIYAIADALEVSIDYLVGKEND